MARKNAREITVQLLYQYELGGDGITSTIEETMELPVPDADDLNYIERVVQGVIGNTEELDEAIEKYAYGWAIDRISKVNLVILRLALYEMRSCEDIPQSVSINEAIDLAHKFASPEDASFINGVLGAVSRDEEK